MTPRTRAVLVHGYTATGVLLALVAAMELCAPAPDPRRVFLALVAATLIDATDGTLARRWQVKRVLPEIDGRTIDDIVDYLTYAFVPLLLIWRMGWVPGPSALWIAAPLVASLFGFANTGAKDEGGGFFLGFPSYWNVVAFYAGFFEWWVGPWINAVLLTILAAATVLPLRFLYPNLAPRPWRRPVVLGAVVWLVVLLWLLRDYPRGPVGLVALSLLYPAFYGVMSLALAGRAGAR
jgi:phosphatidylcholine synthase